MATRKQIRVTAISLGVLAALGSGGAMGTTYTPCSATNPTAPGPNTSNTGAIFGPNATGFLNFSGTSPVANTPNPGDTTLYLTCDPSTYLSSAYSTSANVYLQSGNGIFLQPSAASEVSTAPTISTTLGNTNINSDVTGNTATTSINNGAGNAGATYINNGAGNTGAVYIGSNTDSRSGGSPSGTNLVVLQSGGTQVQLDNNSAAITGTASASLISGGSGFVTYAAPNTVGPGGRSLINGDSASRALINGAMVNNVIVGNTVVDGNMYINGTLVYSSNTSANTTVTSGVSVLPGATTSTVGQTQISNGGGATVNANGKLVAGGATGPTASLTLTNGYGNTHGLVVTETQTTLSGGTQSSSMTLGDNGATFSNAQSGAPIPVHGVADGSSDFDAVNVRQFAGAISAVTAMASIPGGDPSKIASIGVGVGNFMSKTALAVGGSYRFSPGGSLRATVASGLNSGAKATAGLGAVWAF